MSEVKTPNGHENLYTEDCTYWGFWKLYRRTNERILLSVRKYMTEQELLALKKRCIAAYHFGYDIAKSDEIAAQLVNEGATAPSSTVPNALALLGMIAELEASLGDDPSPEEEEQAKEEEEESLAPPPNAVEELEKLVDDALAPDTMSETPAQETSEESDETSQ
jgi:hypothetical protein